MSTIYVLDVCPICAISSLGLKFEQISTVEERKKKCAFCGKKRITYKYRVQVEKGVGT